MIHSWRVAVVAALCLQTLSAAAVSWTDWTSATPGLSGTASGTLATSTGTVGVSYSGEIFFAQTSGGTNYWNPDTAYLSATVENAPPTPDIIGLIGGNAGIKTIEFSAAVVNPVLAIVSLGRPGAQVDYVFDAPFTILSNGQGYWGNGPLTNLGGNTLRGAEGHGVIQFTGTYTSISWTAPIPENWHGFQVGVSEIPEPSSIVLAAAGLGVLAYLRRSKGVSH